MVKVSQVLLCDSLVSRAGRSSWTENVQIVVKVFKVSRLLEGRSINSSPRDFLSELCQLVVVVW
jgi:hypothetical protein